MIIMELKQLIEERLEADSMECQAGFLQVLEWIEEAADEH